MTDKDFASKLAAGMRRAKEPAAMEASVPAAAPAPAPVARPAAQPSRPAATGHGNPWTNLHPTRIWPD